MVGPCCGSRFQLSGWEWRLTLFLLVPVPRARELEQSSTNSLPYKTAFKGQRAISIGSPCPHHEAFGDMWENILLESNVFPSTKLCISQLPEDQGKANKTTAAEL